MKKFRLDGKNAVVTGGGTGLGQAIASVLHEAGARVNIIGRRLELLEETCEELGEECNIMAADLTDLSSIPPLVRNIEKVSAPIDILVNNAGINQKKPALEVSDEEFSEIIRVNLQSVFALSREVALSMSSRKSGVILNISSMAALYGIPYVISYSSSKSGLLGLTRSLASEWAEFGIRVNAIAPGFIKSAMSDKALGDDPQRHKRVLARTPMGRLGSPEDIALASLFLVSDASSYITGAVLPVDGGNLIGF